MLMPDEMNESWATKVGPVQVHRRRKRRSFRNCAKISSKAIEDFAAQTSIHGVKYAFEPKRHYVERFIWVISVAICTAAAAILVQISLEKFYNNPTITSIYSFTNESRSFPFPSVTICNVNLIFRYQVNKFLATLKIPEHVNVSRERLGELLPNVAVLLRPSLGGIDHNALPILNEILEANNVTMLMAVQSLSQPCEDMIEQCSWDGTLILCGASFIKRPTFRSFCCSFNLLDKSNWTHHPDRNPYKLRSRWYGPGSGLHVLLNPMQSEYTWGSYMSSGFSVAIHKSGVIPDGVFTYITPGSERHIQVSLDFTDTDRSLETVQFDRRKCFFYDERSLKSAKTYSREACVLDCRAAAVMAICNCVPFYYMVPGLLDRPINKTGSPCNLTHVNCLRANLPKIESEETIHDCQCLSQCSSLTYDIGTTTSDFDAVEYYVGDFYRGKNTTDRASVNIYLSTQEAKVTQVSLIYTFEQLLSKLGGIASLFLGCSFLTAMEVVYYALLRICALLWCHPSKQSSPSSINSDWAAWKQT